jgi:hypothetical protein
MGGLFGGEFGRFVTAVGDNILAGAHGNSTGGIDTAGMAYLLDGQTGELLLRIPNPEPGEFDFFGWTVAARGSDILVAAPNDTFGGLAAAGSVYLFEGPQPSIAGDYDADGVVDQTDLDLVLLNWGVPGVPPPEGWLSNLPGLIVDQRELDSALLHWGDVRVSITDGRGVPEPSGLLIVAVMLVAHFAVAHR